MIDPTTGQRFKLTKTHALQYLQAHYTGFGDGCSEVVMVEDDAETAKHVCYGRAGISVLPRAVYQINDEGLIISIVHWYCPQCRKLIANKYFL